jgi:hypothetical protein
MEHKEEDDSTDEIEITPEMLEAGLRELSYYHPGEDSADFAAEVVATIYREMRRLRRKSEVSGRIGNALY